MVILSGALQIISNGAKVITHVSEWCMLILPHKKGSSKIQENGIVAFYKMLRISDEYFFMKQKILNAFPPCFLSSFLLSLTNRSLNNQLSDLLRSRLAFLLHW